MFQYRWRAATLDKLAAVYITLSLPDQDRLAAGVEPFNAQLAADPLQVGESRVAGYRVAFPPLLQVLFYVDEAARQVEVTNVRRYGR